MPSGYDECSSEQTTYEVRRSCSGGLHHGIAVVMLVAFAAAGVAVRVIIAAVVDVVGAVVVVVLVVLLCRGISRNTFNTILV